MFVTAILTFALAIDPPKIESAADQAPSETQFRSKTDVVLQDSASVRLLFFPIKINQVSCTLLLDTGATFTVIDPHYAEKVKLKLIKRQDHRALIDIAGQKIVRYESQFVKSEIIGLPIADLPVAIHELRCLDVIQDFEPKLNCIGVFGLDWISTYSMDIKVSRKMATLYDPFQIEPNILGDWKSIGSVNSLGRVSIDGEPIKKISIQKKAITFSGDTFRSEVPYLIYPKTELKSMELRFLPDETNQCIYDIDGDILRLVGSFRKSDPWSLRPKAIDLKKDDLFEVLIMHKVKNR